MTPKDAKQDAKQAVKQDAKQGEKIVAYYRRRTDKPMPASRGLRAQKRTVRQFAEKSSGQIVDEFIEVEDGKDTDRPKLEEAVQRCQEIGAMLVIPRRGRLDRSLTFAKTLVESDVEFHICDHPEITRSLLRAQAKALAAENQQVRENIREGLLVAAESGVKLGSARPGHWDGREHLRNPKKAAQASAKVRSEAARDAYLLLMPEILEMHSSGYSYEEIAKFLNDAGHRNAIGAPFHSVQIHRMIKRYGREFE